MWKKNKKVPKKLYVSHYTLKILSLDREEIEYGEKRDKL